MIQIKLLEIKTIMIDMKNTLNWIGGKCYFHKLEGIETTWNEELRKMTKQSEEHSLTLG